MNSFHYEVHFFYCEIDIKLYERIFVNYLKFIGKLIKINNIFT